MIGIGHRRKVDVMRQHGRKASVMVNKMVIPIIVDWGEKIIHIQFAPVGSFSKENACGFLVRTVIELKGSGGAGCPAA